MNKKCKLALPKSNSDRIKTTIALNKLENLLTLKIPRLPNSNPSKIQKVDDVYRFGSPPIYTDQWEARLVPVKVFRFRELTAMPTRDQDFNQSLSWVVADH